MSHIEMRRQLWYATLKVVSAKAQVSLGRKKFLKSLGTSDKRKAQELAKPLIALWKAKIRQAEGESDAVHVEALRWREALAAIREAGDDDHLEALEGVVTSEAEAIEKEKGEEAAVHFAQVALGARTPSDLFFEDWAASIVHLANKTQDQMKKDVRVLIAQFPVVEGISPQAVRKWVHEATTRTRDPMTTSSVKRMLSFWRSYWRFLVTQEAAQSGVDPFAKVELPAKTKLEASKSRWIPFPREEVPSLVAAAREKGDSDLADLIVLGAYTGARIEELCALKLDHVGADSLRIVDAKTIAGVREVPIHAALRPLLKRLREASKDGYLLTGLTFNKYDDRSNAIGKRFGRLKTAMGYGGQHVFHSLRKTLVTMLEDAGVSENLAADIVGHEKPRITYGLYSGGASLSTKAAALAKVSYGGLEVT